MCINQESAWRASSYLELKLSQFLTWLFCKLPDCCSSIHVVEVVSAESHVPSLSRLLLLTSCFCPGHLNWLRQSTFFSPLKFQNRWCRKYTNVYFYFNNQKIEPTSAKFDDGTAMSLVWRRLQADFFHFLLLLLIVFSCSFYMTGLSHPVMNFSRYVRFLFG